MNRDQISLQILFTRKSLIIFLAISGLSFVTQHFLYFLDTWDSSCVVMTFYRLLIGNSRVFIIEVNNSYDVIFKWNYLNIKYNIFRFKILNNIYPVCEARASMLVVKETWNQICLIWRIGDLFSYMGLT